MPMVGGALLRIRILLFSLSLVPQNSKNNIGFGLAVFSWTNMFLFILAGLS